MPDIQMPDGQVVRFPDTMSETAIRGMIAQKYPREVGEMGAAKPMAERETAGHYSFDGSNIPGYDPQTGNVPDPYDASKSYGAGLRRGVEGIVGAVGDAGPMQGAVASWLANKVGASPETAGTIGDVASRLTPFAFAPTTSEIQQAVTDPVLGEGYQPQSTIGKYASTVGEFGAGALAPGGIARKTAMVAVPAIASEAAGQFTEGTPYEPYARMAAGLVTGGLLTPSIATNVRNAASTLGAKSKDLTRVIKQMQRDGFTPAQINTRLAELGPDATLMDVGPNLRQEGQRIYAKGGEGRATINSALAPRDAAANSRIRADVDAAVGPAPVPSQIEQGIATNQEALSPSYGSVLGNARRVETQGIADQLASDVVNLRGRAQQAAQRVRGMLNINGTSHLDPSPRTLFETRKAIDGMIATETDPNALRVLSRTRAAVDQELSRSVPGLKDVDAQYSEMARQREALGRGQQSLDSGRTAPRPTELADEFQQGALPQGQQIGPSAAPVRLRQGARAEMDRIIGTNANDRVALQRLIKGEGDWNRDRLTTLFGQDRADRLIGVLDRESTFAETSNRIIKNSATAERLPEGQPIFGVREGLMAGGVKGAAYSAAVRGVEKAVEGLGLRNSGRSDANVARLLSDTDRNRIVTALLKANDGRPVSQAQIDTAVRAALIGIESSRQSGQ